MSYSLSHKCVKNLCKRTVLVQLIIKNVVTCFLLEHSVDAVDTGPGQQLDCADCLATVARSARAQCTCTEGYTAIM